MKGEMKSALSSHELYLKNSNLNLNAQALYYAGLLPSKRQDKYFYLRNAWAIATIVFSAAHVCVLDLINLITSYDDPNVLSQSGLMIATHMFGLTASVTFYLRKDNTRDVLEGINKLHITNYTVDEEQKSVSDDCEDKIKKTNKMFACLASFSTVVVALLAVQSYLSRRLMFSIWLPFDYKSSPVFEIVFISQYASLFMSFNLFIVIISFTINNEIAIIAQFRILGLKLKNIRKQATVDVDYNQYGSEIKSRDNNEDNQSQVIIKDLYTDEVKAGHYSRDVPGVVPSKQVPIVSVHHTVEDRHAHIVNYLNVPSELPGNDALPTSTNAKFDHQSERICKKIESDENFREHDSSLSDTGNKARSKKFLARKKKKRREKEMNGNFEVQQMMRFPLRNYLIQHQHLLKVVDDFYALIQLPMLSAILTYIAMLAIFLLYASGKPSFDTFMVTQLIQILTCGTYIFLIWFRIECISDEAAGIGESAYCSDWFDSTEEFKRSLRLIITRANVPLTLSIAGFDMTMETVASVTKTAYSWFNMLAKSTKK